MTQLFRLILTFVAVLPLFSTSCKSRDIAGGELSAERGILVDHSGNLVPIFALFSEKDEREPPRLLDLYEGESGMRFSYYVPKIGSPQRAPKISDLLKLVFDRQARIDPTRAKVWYNNAIRLNAEIEMVEKFVSRLKGDPKIFITSSEFWGPNWGDDLAQNSLVPPDYKIVPLVSYTDDETKVQFFNKMLVDNGFTPEPELKAKLQINKLWFKFDSLNKAATITHLAIFEDALHRLGQKKVFEMDRSIRLMAAYLFNDLKGSLNEGAYHELVKPFNE